MKKIKEILVKLNDWKFVILVILIIGGAFYWFQIRPSLIKKNCFDFVKNFYKGDNFNVEGWNFGYSSCLHSKGL